MRNRSCSVAAGLTYPFEHYELSAARARFVREQLTLLEGRFDLFDNRAEFHRIIATFIDQCSSREPSERSLELLCHFLYMTLYFNESRTRTDVTELAFDYWRALRGQPVLARHPVLSAAREFAPALQQLIAEGSADPSGLFHYLSLNLSAFCESREPQRCPRAYMRIRIHSISALGYFQFWKLLMGLDARIELRYGSKIFRSEMLSAKVQALANDLCSQERDEAEGVPNVIGLVGAELGLDVDGATAIVEGWHARSVEELAQIDNAEDPVALHEYLMFIKSCAWGNLRSMRILTDRYA